MQEVEAKEVRDFEIKDDPRIHAHGCDVGITNDLMIMMDFHGECLECSEAHPTRTGYIAVEPEMAVHIVEALQKCLKRVSS